MAQEQKYNRSFYLQEPRSKFLSGGRGREGRGLKKNGWAKFFKGEGHAWEVFFNFVKVTENDAFITIKLLIFGHIFNDIGIESQNPPSLHIDISYSLS